MKTLIVVDMQNDFITGSLGTKEARAIVPNVRKKIEEYVKNGHRIIYTRDTHFEDYMETKEGEKLPVKHCVKDTEGWYIAHELTGPMIPGWIKLKEDGQIKFINKFTFGYTDLWRWVDRDSSEVELVGLCTDICVVSNALLLKAAFYEVMDISVDATCCAGVTPETHEAALKTMEMCQINVKR